MKMKQIDVTIMGQTYVLGCPPGGDEALMEAVATVDREMTNIKEAGKVKARERIAVLAALNLAYALAGRGAEEAAPAAAAAPSAPSGSTSEASLPDPADADTIARLLRRLDHAIGADDRLL
jgi:cell division protein ZapA